jgi:hypothetical protein
LKSKIPFAETATSASTIKSKRSNTKAKKKASPESVPDTSPTLKTRVRTPGGHIDVSVALRSSTPPGFVNIHGRYFHDGAKQPRKSRARASPGPATDVNSSVGAEMVSDEPSASRLEQHGTNITSTSSEATIRHGVSGAEIEDGNG